VSRHTTHLNNSIPPDSGRRQLSRFLFRKRSSSFELVLQAHVANRRTYVRRIEMGSGHKPGTAALTPPWCEVTLRERKDLDEIPLKEDEDRSNAPLCRVFPVSNIPVFSFPNLESEGPKRHVRRPEPINRE
jgi:hypothetical protein